MYNEAAGIMGNYGKYHAKKRHAGLAGPLGPTPSFLLVSALGGDSIRRHGVGPW